MRISSKLSSVSNTLIIYIIIIIAIPVIFSCCSGNKSSKSKKSTSSAKHIKYFEVKTPTKSQIIYQDESFIISFAKNKNHFADSILLTYNKSLIQTTRVDSLSFSAIPETKLVGNQSFDLVVYFADSLTEKHSITLFILPNNAPVNYTYKILRTFEHDPSAYTQGLLYKDGCLYESTGKRKQSTLRKIDLKTGNVVKNKALEPEFFGEGIALVGKEIYMITYVSQVGLVYDAVTFDLIRKFSLQTREGWGLTTYGSELILSDGSASLYFFDPNYFSLTKQIEVCDNKGLVSKINELEHTEYGLFANVYGESYIVLIDETTGIVKGKIDLSGLIPKGIPNNFDYVLNGIAFNPEKKTFYVTGKQWPVIHEIKINID